MSLAPALLAPTVIRLLLPRRRSLAPSGSVRCPLLPSLCRLVNFPTLPPLEMSISVASTWQAPSHPWCGILFWRPLFHCQSSSFLVLPKIAVSACIFSSVLFLWWSFFSVVHAHACPWVFFASRALLQLVPFLLGVEELSSACFISFGLSAFEVGACVFSVLLAGLAPRRQFTADGRHLSSSHAPALGNWHGKPSTHPVDPGDVLWPAIGQFSTLSACILPFFSKTSNSG